MKSVVFGFLAFFGLVFSAHAGVLPRGAQALSGPTAMQTAYAAACIDCWFDTNSTVSTAPTINSVAWNCTAQPCSSNGEPGTPSDAPTTASLDNFAAITFAWIGAMDAPDQHLVLVWGGGHDDAGASWCGNDIYAFDTHALTWSRVTVPSSITGYNCHTSTSITYPDGRPVGPHTYDSQACPTGSSKCFEIGECGSQVGGCGRNSFALDMGLLTSVSYGPWSIAPNFPVANGGDIMAKYDSSSGAIFATVDSASLYKLASPYTGAWACQGTCTDQTVSFNATAALKPGAYFVQVGSGATNNFTVWDLTTGNVSTRSFSGDATIPSATAPGFVYDTTSGKFVGWDGGTAIYTLDPATWIFASHTISGSNTVTPACSDTSNCSSATGAQKNGTFSRFVRIDNGDGTREFCIVANSYLDHTYCFKPGTL